MNSSTSYFYTRSALSDVWIDDTGTSKYSTKQSRAYFHDVQLRNLVIKGAVAFAVSIKLGSNSNLSLSDLTPTRTHSLSNKVKYASGATSPLYLGRDYSTLYINLACSTDSYSTFTQSSFAIASITL